MGSGSGSLKTIQVVPAANQASPGGSAPSQPSSGNSAKSTAPTEDEKDGQPIVPVLGIVGACQAAMLPDRAMQEVIKTADAMGAVDLSELLREERFEALTKAAKLKPLQAERLATEFRAALAARGADAKASDAAFASASASISISAAIAAGASMSMWGPEESRKSMSGVKMRSRFWEGQCRGRPKRVVFIRHGESEANIDREITALVPDHELHLTPKGRQQALEAGERLKAVIAGGKATFIVSPYVRTRETLSGIQWAWRDEPEKPRARMDVRIREQEFGNFDREDMGELHKEKTTFGAFYYRFPDGESPADCYDRASSFLESLYRNWEDNQIENYVIVSHGMMIQVMLMRLMRIPVDDFDTLMHLENCEFVVLERPATDPMYNIAYTWRADHEKDYGGLRKKELGRKLVAIWSGDPEAPILKSTPHATRVRFLQKTRSRLRALSAFSSARRNSSDRLEDRAASNPFSSQEGSFQDAVLPFEGASERPSVKM